MNMNIQLVRESLAAIADVSFSRSGGPGGQNVNKVNTKVLLTIDLNRLEGITSVELERIKRKLGDRLKSASFLSVFVDEERSQFRNREIATEKVLSILVQANKMEKRRIPTKPSKSSKVARLSSKKAHSTIKSGRRNPVQEY
jgi:ribosome-associated protein